MYGDNSEDIFYYLTVYNEPIFQPVEPENLDVAGLLKGLYRYSPAKVDSEIKAQILSAGISVQWALKAQQLLAQDWGVAADVWSATSWTELRRDAIECEQHNLRHPEDKARVPYVTQALSQTEGPVVAVSDWMRAVPDLISRWVPGDYTSLGTDGFGMSDTRAALRRHFNVDAESIVVAVLGQLAKQGKVDASAAAEAFRRYAIDDVNAAPAGRQVHGGDEGKSSDDVRPAPRAARGRAGRASQQPVERALPAGGRPARHHGVLAAPLHRRPRPADPSLRRHRVTSRGAAGAPLGTPRR
jgi:pyruvate dehydrogenase E1 component